MASDTGVNGLLSAMKRAAAILRDHHVDFALAGGQAIYAHGGPESGHDVDFVLRREDAEDAVALLSQAGFQAERPPEGWLYKVRDDDALVDLIFAPNNRAEDVPEILGRAEEMEIDAITIKVMSVTDVLASKLLALKEHEVDYDDVLAIARACREQIDWDVLRELTGDSPYARAFFTLVEELGLVA
jgi:predicted nucleotidyltransferase